MVGAEARPSVPGSSFSLGPSVRAPGSGRTLRKEGALGSAAVSGLITQKCSSDLGVWPSERNTGFGGRWVPVPALLLL